MSLMYLKKNFWIKNNPLVDLRLGIDKQILDQNLKVIFILCSIVKNCIDVTRKKNNLKMNT